jgi:hypothetical protein
MCVEIHEILYVQFMQRFLYSNLQEATNKCYKYYFLSFDSHPIPYFVDPGILFI